jgi:hypothetical protein
MVPHHWCLNCSSKQFGDQCDLPSHIAFVHPLQLSFPQHVHHLKSLQCSPCGQIREEAHARFCQAFDEPMILFNEIIEILDLSQFTAFGKVSCCLELAPGFGIGGVFIERSTRVVRSYERRRAFSQRSAKWCIRQVGGKIKEVKSKSEGG